MALLDQLQAAIDITQPQLSSEATDDIATRQNDDWVCARELDGEVIEYSEEPTEEKWALVSIRMASPTGETMIWQIGFDPHVGCLIRLYGYETTPSGDQGEITKDILRIETNQSSQSLQERALLQAKEMYRDKYRMGYRPAGIIGEDLIQLQLANKYLPPTATGPKKSGESVIDEKEFSRSPMACQVNPNGISGRVRKRADGSISIRSRQNREFLWLEHIRSNMKEFFMYLPEGCGIDGVMYTHELTFEELTSAVKTEKTKHHLNHLAKFYILDIIIPSMILEERIKVLKNAYRQFLKDGNINTDFFIITHSYAKSNADIMSLHDQSVICGYEGLSIRWLAGPNPTQRQIERSWYKGRRNNNLLRYKRFINEEGIVVGVHNGEGHEGNLAIFTIRDERGNEFSIRPRGSFERRRHWLQYPEKCIGKPYTFRYFKLTDHNVPLSPVGIAFRDYD